MRDRAYASMVLALAVSACATARGEYTDLSASSGYGASSAQPPNYQEYPAPPPRPAFEFENVPTPISQTTPAYRRPTRAEDEQRLTAERLAQWQRNGVPMGSMTTTAAVATGIQPALVPVVASNAAPVAGTDYARTDYYAGDIYQGASIPAMPTSARPGECYALVRTPEQYRNLQRDYVARPGYDGVQLRPAQYQVAMQDVVSQEAYERLEIVPATFKTVTEQVEISPPTVRYLPSEPSYETVTEKVLERPAIQTWKRGRGPVEKRDSATGEIMCLVEEPAVYRTVTRQVLKNQPPVREMQVPGEYRTVTRRVIDRPAEVRHVLVPEQRTKMQVQKMVSPAGYERVRIPDQVASYTMRELAAPATLEWRAVLCETNVNPGTVRRVQDALRNAGFDPGASDGRAGKRTLDALNAYQRAHKLPEDRYLNLQTLQALGISYS